MGRNKNKNKGKGKEKATDTNEAPWGPGLRLIESYLADATKGALAHAFASILHEMWHGEMPYISPYPFRVRALVCTRCARG